MPTDDELEALFRVNEEERLREWMADDPYNVKTLAKWSRVTIPFPDKTRPDYTERLEACMRYVVRRLTRGYVPQLALIHGVLSGEVALPKCGTLGCFLTDEDHVH